MILTRQQQKEQTKERLLKTAFEEFSAGGLLATKTLDIARAAKLSHGAIFVHFPTRETLMLAVIHEFGMQLGTEFQKSMKEGSFETVLKTHLSSCRNGSRFIPSSSSVASSS